MAHFTVDYSPNLEPEVDIAALCDLIRRAAIDTGVFPLPGIRVRAFAATHISIADGNAQHGYIDIAVRLRGGRSNSGDGNGCACHGCNEFTGHRSLLFLFISTDQTGGPCKLKLGEQPLDRQ